MFNELLYRYRHCFWSFRHNMSGHAETMLRGYLQLSGKRTCTEIASGILGDVDKAQNLQQFMSDSKWDHNTVFGQVCADIVGHLGLSSGTLNIDEVGLPCVGRYKAGSSHQYMGTTGHVEQGQVAVLASYYCHSNWLLTGAELYLPQSWFSEPFRSLWSKLRIAADTTFKTKIQLACDLIARNLSSGLVFERVGADSLYGRSSYFRHYIRSLGKKYVVSIPSDTFVWLSDPLTDAQAKASSVSEIAKTCQTETITVRDTERGELTTEHAFVAVWTKISQEIDEKEETDKPKKRSKKGNKGDTAEISEVGETETTNELTYTFQKEVLCIRKEDTGAWGYALSNYALSDKLAIAEGRSERYFVERTIQDGKSELGMDDSQALKYTALMRNFAICAMALVLLATFKLHLQEQQPPIEEVQETYPDVKKVPQLSLKNLKVLLCAAIKLPPISDETAIKMVKSAIENRTKSKQSKSKHKNLN